VRHGTLLATAACLRRDCRGATAVEFAAIAPALLMVVLGLMDLGYNIYAVSILEGAIQRAGRDSSLQGASSATIDAAMRDAVEGIAPNATIAVQRRAYTDFSDVGEPEEFTDSNEDGTCNEGELFADANGNGTWDQDRGRDDMGGARDAVLYSVTVRYPRAFPVMGLLGFDKTVATTSQTILRNQPFGPQNRAVGTGNCDE
jgi:Flp pilus assembly protein TadG